jgi:glycogen synthase
MATNDPKDDKLKQTEPWPHQEIAERHLGDALSDVISSAKRTLKNEGKSMLPSNINKEIQKAREADYTLRTKRSRRNTKEHLRELRDLRENSRNPYHKKVSREKKRKARKAGKKVLKQLKNQNTQAIRNAIEGGKLKPNNMKTNGY